MRINSWKDIFLFIFIALLPAMSHSQEPKRTETIHLNGIDLYYEVQGEGVPLFLLHGWTQSSQFWSEYLPRLAEQYTVYNLDLRGHGHTSPLGKNFSIQKTAKDVAMLIEHLGLSEIKAIGLSFGSLVLLQLAHDNPSLLGSMVLISASHQYKGGENDDPNTSFKFKDLDTSFVQYLRSIHPQGDTQIEAMFNPKLNYEIQLANEDLTNMDTRTLIIHGDRDEIIDVEQAFILHRNLSNSQLWVVPNAGHIPIMGGNSSGFIQTALEFLKEVKDK